MADESRIMTKDERIEARHWLQQLAEHARLVREALDLQHGMPDVKVSTWAAQWGSLTRELDQFTERVKAGKRAVGGIRDRNADGY